MRHTKLFLTRITNKKTKNGEDFMAEEKTGFIVKFFDKAYEDKSIMELAEAPVAAIRIVMPKTNLTDTPRT